VIDVRTLRAYRFALDLTPSQERAVVMFAGAARSAHNVMLARVKAVLEQRAAERSYNTPDEAITPALGWSLAALRRQWNQIKDEIAPWWRECSAQTATGEMTTAGSGSVAGRGANHKTPNLGQEAKKRQPGSTPVDKTGTVLLQGRTAA
jgi:hypothetical protein